MSMNLNVEYQDCFFRTLLGQEDQKSIEMNQIPCRFKENCFRFDCHYSHPPGRKQLCQNADNCTHKNCLFLHPNKTTLENANENDDNASTLSSNSASNTLFCHLNQNCVDYYCKFRHPLNRTKVCRFSKNCNMNGCTKLHPPLGGGGGGGDRGIGGGSEADSGAEASGEAGDGSHRGRIGSSSHGPPKNANQSNQSDHHSTSTSTALPCPRAVDCIDLNCQLTHPPQRKGPCRFGKKCFLSNCVYLHPKERNLPPIPTAGAGGGVGAGGAIGGGANEVFRTKTQLDVNCGGSGGGVAEAGDGSHRGRIGSSSHGPPNNDLRSTSTSTALPCPRAVDCIDLNCQLTHPPQRKSPCRFGKKCFLSNCVYLHPKEREPCPEIRVCPLGEACLNFYCKASHPPSREICTFGKRCSEYSCQKVHPHTRPNLCNEDCKIVGCQLIHPMPETEDDEDDDDISVIRPPLDGRRPPSRSLVQRNRLKSEASLPILSCRNEFCDRLNSEGVLIVTAETGSGKTTQLPQYCADDSRLSRGLVICTQPRAIAALSIADRIASEYDGAKVGNSVGYSVRGKEVLGSRIMLMTDASLITLAQRDPLLSQVSVLMIDEAHERSLNTDIVLGIAKLIRAQRPDFRVLVASATIDPTPFLNFFFSDADSSVSRLPLNVSGRTFPVSLEEIPCQGSEKDQFSRRINLLVPSVLEALKTNKEGHCLAFLPGAQEVDAAVTAFRNKVSSSEFDCFPLYDCLSPEEQRKVVTYNPNSKKRMVVFCTNIAETSLTVPGVKLIVDTGLAKEATFDPRRRINVLQLVNISQSSAKQRQGRAGRTEAGHCVRLYSMAEDCERENIEPEILRSSLDKVVLQLCILRQDPRTFPLMDRPRSELLDTSIELLSNFGCLTSSLEVTEIGRIFNDLDFDPRMSNFIFKSSEFGLGRTATEIASILTAPSSIFATASGRGRERIGNLSGDHQSDLLFYRSLYLDWLRSGSVEEGKCVTCNKIPIGRTRTCRKCRIAFCMKNNLNNKVLEVVEQTVSSVLKRHSTISDQNMDQPTAVEMIGKALYCSFPEQICEVVMPNHPSAGGYLCESQLKCRFSDTSFLTNQTGPERPILTRLICMNMVQLPSNLLIVDQIHPIVGSKTPRNALRMVECFSYGPCNSSFCDSISKEFAKEPDRFPFVLVTYEIDRGNHVVVFCPVNQKEEVADISRRHYTTLRDRELRAVLEYSENAFATFTAGLELSGRISIETRKKFNCSTFPPEIRSESEFLTWLQNTHHIGSESIQSCKILKSRNPSGGAPGDSHSYLLTFIDDSIGETLVQRGVVSYFVLGNSEDWGKVVRFKFDGSEGDLVEYFRALSLSMTKIVNKSTTRHFLKLRNLPLTVTEDQIISILGRTKKMTFKKTVPPQAFIDFDRVESLNSAEQVLRASPWLTQSFHLPSNQFGAFAKMITPVIEKESQTNSDFEITFSTVTDCESALQSISADSQFGNANCTTSVLIQHPDFYQELDVMIQRVAQRFGINSQKIPIRSLDLNSPPTVKVIFSQGNPNSLRLGALALERVTKPMTIRATTKKQRRLFSELQSQNTLQEFLDSQSDQLRLETFMEKGECVGFKFHGSTITQGNVMWWIGNQFQEFGRRFQVIELSKASLLYFLPGRKGYQKLMNLECIKALKVIGGLIDVAHSTITIQFPRTLPQEDSDFPLPTMESISEEIDSLRAEFGVQTQSRELTSCSICSEENGCSALSICGHYYCSTCLHDHVTQAVSYEQLPVRCIQCDTSVSINDIKSCFVPSELSSLMKTIVTERIKQDPGIGICPVADCCQPSYLNRGYSLCPGTCGQCVCVQCGLTSSNDEHHAIHQGVSCSAYRKLKRTELKRRVVEGSWSNFQNLIENAKRFVQNSFDAAVGVPVAVNENPGLKRGCPAMQQFCQGLMQASPTGDFQKVLNSVIFGWHGTPTNEAVVGISHSGLDPRRRSGQVHGPGEYFGIIASTSMGYARGLNRLLVCALIPCPQFKRVEGFCYVMNNPVDQSYSMNVPLLVVDYLSHLPPLNWANETPRPFPGPFAVAPVPIAEDDNDEVEEMSIDPIPSYPFRWYWETNQTNLVGERIFHPYKEDISQMIEKHYLSMTERNGPKQFLTPEIIRYVDDIPQSYRIDFEQGLQINPNSNSFRKIQRLEVESTKGKWQVTNQKGIFVSMDSIDQSKLELMFTYFSQRTGPSFFEFAPVGREFSVMINFILQEQTCSRTGEKRRIRRIGGN